MRSLTTDGDGTGQLRHGGPAADQAQAELVGALLAAGRPTVTVALRTPWDLGAYPAARAHVCSYGILPPSMAALADRLYVGLQVDGADRPRLLVLTRTPVAPGHSAASPCSCRPAASEPASASAFPNYSSP